jgi:hypothetical protein
MPHLGWNPVPAGSLTPSHCRTFWMARSRLTDHGCREPSVTQPARMPSSCCEVLRNHLWSSAPTMPSVIARCCGESWTSAARRHFKRTLGDDFGWVPGRNRRRILVAGPELFAANGVPGRVSVTAAIGLCGCLHLLRRTEMVTALVFGFLLSL